MEQKENGLKMTGAKIDAVLEKNASATFYDAVFGFASWLTGRRETVKVGADEDASEMAELASIFCQENGYVGSSSNFPANIKFPKEI